MSTLDALLPAPVNALPRDHLSASSLGTFSRCPEQFRRRYVLGEKERPVAALIWGGVDGATFEYNFRQKIESHEDLPLDDLELKFASILDERVDGSGGPSEVDWGKEYTGKSPAVAFAGVKDRGVKLVGAYRRTVAPLVQPLAVEKQFSYEVSGIGVPIIGFIDIDTEAVTIEAKTSGKAVKAVKNDWRLQGRIYQAVHRKPVAWHVKAKTKLPAVYTPTEEPGLLMPVSEVAISAMENRVRGLVETLLHYIDIYGADEPWPTSAPDSWGNTCGYCGFRPTCPWWAE